MQKRKKQSGFLLIDFLFAIVVGIGFSAVVFAISYGFSMIEVAQYIAFSSARSYLGAHINEQAQQEAAQGKYDYLAEGTYLRTIMSNPWFEVTEAPTFSDFGAEYGYQEQGIGGNSSRFIGARMKVQLNLLAFQWPLLGRAGDPESFQAYITAFLGRQPTFDECRLFLQGRYPAILSLNSKFSQARPDGVFIVTDNGC